MTAGEHDSKRDGRVIPWLFAGFFGVVIMANATMVYFAVSSFTGLQTEDHYLRGLAYNRVLEAERAQQALGWEITVEFQSTGPLRGHIIVHARDAAGAPLGDATIVAHFVRPAESGYDMDIRLSAERDGVQTAEVELPLPGLWEIQTQIVHPSGVYRTARRISAP